MCRGLQETLRPVFLEGLGAGMEGGLGAGMEEGLGAGMEGGLAAGMEGGLGAGSGGVGPTAMAQACPLHPLNAPYFTLVLYVLLAS